MGQGGAGIGSDINEGMVRGWSEMAGSAASADLRLKTPLPPSSRCVSNVADCECDHFAVVEAPMGRLTRRIWTPPSKSYLHYRDAKFAEQAADGVQPSGARGLPPLSSPPMGTADILLCSASFAATQAVDEPRGTFAWQSSQPVEKTAAFNIGSHPSKPRVAGSSPAGRALLNRGASPRELHYTFARPVYWR